MADASLSQDEIEALLSGASDAGMDQAGGSGDNAGSGDIVADDLGQLKTIVDTMAGAQANSLSAITTKNSTLTVNSCEILNLSDALLGMDGEVLVCKLNYEQPESGNVFYVFKGADGLQLASIMTGSETTSLDEMAFSAIQEAFNQMVGASDTAVQAEHKVMMSNTGPKLSAGNVPDNLTIPDGDYLAVKMSINVEDAINSSFVQLYPTGIAKSMTKSNTADSIDSGNMDMDNLLGGGAATESDNIQNAEFSQLVQTQEPAITGNIDLLLDVPMDVTVELGRSTRTVQEVLSLGEGSIIELDKLAGEPVDLLVNGKPIAKGEVVVIDENFGVRVTEIVSPRQRIAASQ